MKKFRLIIIALVIVIILIICGFIVNSTNYQYNDKHKGTDILGALNPTSTLLHQGYLVEDIIIGTIKSAETDYDYLELEDEIIKESKTVGELKVKKVFKGDLKNGSKIPFTRAGGMVPISEQEKNLTEEQVKELGYDKLTQEEKDQQYVFDSTKHDVPVEKGKTYLMFLGYNEEKETYSICGGPNGINEVKETFFNWIYSIFNPSKCKVKNNMTGKYENLKYMVPKVYLEN